MAIIYILYVIPQIGPSETDSPRHFALHLAELQFERV